MKVLTHRKFKKSFSKVPQKIQTKFYIQIEIFLQNEFDSRLRNHALVGEYKGIHSIDITGDWRILYEKVNTSTVMLIDIGTHSQLYK